MVDSQITSGSSGDSSAGPAKPSLVRTAASYVLLVYLWGVMLAFPYFSWRYAQEHGFLAWLFFGEFVPAAKSVVWPYYAVSSLLEKGWTNEEKENLAHVGRGAKAMRKALILLEGFGKAGRKPTPTDSARVRELLREALDESQLVRDDVLMKIHPEYAKMYREKYVSSLKRLVALFDAEAPDPDELTAILDTLDEWSEWLHAHRNELRVPKGVADE